MIEKSLQHFQTIMKSWREELHPRDSRGRFAKTGEGKRSEAYDKIKVFHGTSLYSTEIILEEGFKVSGYHNDFGDCAYFKSPQFDHLDHEDHRQYVKKRQEAGQKVYDGDDYRGNDTVDVLSDIFIDDEAPSVIEAEIPENYVLDCTKGRPEELDNLIKNFQKASEEDGYRGRERAIIGYVLGKDYATPEEVDHFMNTEGELLASDEGHPILGMKDPELVSPYEAYCRKHGYKAVVDKLDQYTHEGWQIGVYDPDIINITDHGKGISFEGGMVNLVKALQKSLPYALMHHKFENGKLKLYVGTHG